jgi:hypothetical protein
MAVVQSTYPVNIVAGLAGQPADMTNFVNDTKNCETVAGIGFGLAVSQGAADRGVTLGGAAFVGISVRDVTLTSVNADKYPRYASMSVMAKGDIWAVALNGAAIGAQVLFDAATGDLGKTAGTAIAGSRWMTAASAGGLAIARLS